MKTPCVAFDLDGTLAQGKSGFSEILDPIPGTKELVEAIVARGVRCIVLTARDDLDAVREWLARHGYPAIEVTNVKPPYASVIVDDRAVPFHPVFVRHPEAIERLAQTLCEFRPYWKQEANDF